MADMHRLFTPPTGWTPPATTTLRAARTTPPARPPQLDHAALAAVVATAAATAAVLSEQARDRKLVRLLEVGEAFMAARPRTR